MLGILAAAGKTVATWTGLGWAPALVAAVAVAAAAAIGGHALFGGASPGEVAAERRQAKAELAAAVERKASQVLAEAAERTAQAEAAAAKARAEAVTAEAARAQTWAALQVAEAKAADVQCFEPPTVRRINEIRRGAR